MQTVKSVVKRALPAPVIQTYRRTGSFRAALDLSWLRALSAMRLAALKLRRRNERCFIIGNGPSLNRTDLTRLRNEATFGLNRIYLLFGKLGFETTYHVCVNRLVIEQCAREIEALHMPRFVSWHSRDLIERRRGMIFVGDPYDGSLGFSKSPADCVWEGATVTYVAMQLAYYLGYRQVVLVGVDHNFVSRGTPHQAVTSTGADPDHFDANYFGKGFRWQLPDLEASEAAYRLAKDAFEADGREIVDATVGGKLTVFRKVRYESLFD